MSKILLWSKYSDASNHLLNLLRDSAVDYSSIVPVCVDNTAVRQRILSDQRLAVKKVPCLIEIDVTGNHATLQDESLWQFFHDIENTADPPVAEEPVEEPVKPHAVEEPVEEAFQEAFQEEVFRDGRTVTMLDTLMDIDEVEEGGDGGGVEGGGDDLAKNPFSGSKNTDKSKEDIMERAQRMAKSREKAEKNVERPNGGRRPPTGRP